jgi:CubicO group peptidase (beta-lactamase class C family)
MPAHTLSGAEGSVFVVHSRDIVPGVSLAESFRGARVSTSSRAKWAYSNCGFTTLGQVVEDVSGIRLDRYLRGRVFDPLGMKVIQ